MSFVSNTKGPRKSAIVQKLGPDYFGISMEKLDVEIQLSRDEDFEGLVNPVYGDKDRRQLIKFKAPNRKVQRSYIEENGYYLEGRVNEIFL